MIKKIFILTLLLSLCACKSSNNTNKLVVGMECNYAPFNWTSVENSGVKISDVDYCDGYDVKIASKIASDLNKELVVKKIAWEGLISSINTGEIDVIIAGMTKTEERSQALDFTTPYYESEMVLIVKNDSPLKNATTLQDFSNKKVLGQINTIYDEVIDQIPNVNHITPLPSYPFMVAALLSSEVDAIVAELPVALGVVEANKDLAVVSFKAGNGFVADTTVSIAVKKGNQELLNSIQTSLDKITKEERNQLMVESVKTQPTNN